MNRILGSLFVGLLAPSALAQCFDTNFGTLLGSGQDLVFPIQPIGFAFPLGGATYTDIHVSDHCCTFLSNAGVPIPPASGSAILYTPTTAQLVAGSPTVCPLWADIIADVGQVFLNSSATRCTVTWQDVHNFGIATPLFTLQMQLLPTGECYFFYGPGVTNNSTFGGASQVGIAGVSPGGGVLLPAPSDLSAGGVTVDNTIFEQWTTPNTFDMAGTGLHLIRTNPGWVFTPPGGNCASAANYGQGCIQKDDSFFEQWSSAGFDLSNTTLTMLRTATGYVVINTVPGTFVPPGGGAQNVAPGALDGEQLFVLPSAMPVAGGTTSNLMVCTKGYISVAAGNGIDYTPSGAELLAMPQTVFACWHDYNQTAVGSGLITFEVVGGIAYVTWNAVYSYPAITPPCTFQFQFDLTTGNVTLVMGTFSGAASPDQIVVGYSVGGPSSVAATDLSALVGALAVSDVGNSGLALTTNGLPTLGNALFALDTSNVPNLVPLGFLFFGDTVLPGIDLSFLGMPNCRAYTNGNLGSFTFPVALPAGTGSALLPIANSVGLIGAFLTCQSLAFSLDTPLNLITSNGTSFTVGN